MRVETPAARNTDPITSHLAAEKHTQSKAREIGCKVVTEYVRRKPGQTSRELSVMFEDDRYFIARRLPDANGLTVRQGPKRKCVIAGTMAVTWWLINDG